ncbi:esterase/lipase family protein [Embleya sp. NPDC001921]
MSDNAARGDVVPVHGGFVDGSGWQGVYEALKDDGHNVAVVRNPTLSLEGDVTATRTVIDAMPGPVTLVGHSYGGVVVTEAGNHDKVARLVYIAAFAPDKGESVNTLIAGPPPGAAPSQPPIGRPQQLRLEGEFTTGPRRDASHRSSAHTLPGPMRVARRRLRRCRQ